MTRSAEDMRYVLEGLEINPATSPERFSQCLDAMVKYDKPWWSELRGNIVALANAQIDQPVLLIPWNTFKAGVEKVLGRPLMKGELSSANTELIKEFHKKYEENYGD